MSSQPSPAERRDAGDGQVVFEDGLGVRVRDESAGDLVERLVVCQELIRFESALRDRMGRLANFKHVRYPRVRAVERTGSGEDLAVAVVTDAVKGYRLSAVLEAAVAHDLIIDVNAALQVARELLPALSVLHDSRNVTHGALGPERIVLTPEARIVIVDHTVGLALERLRFPRSRLWREFRIAMPPSAGLPQFDQRADVAQVALVILALVLGRHIAPKEFPDGLRALASEAPERLGGGAVRPMTASLRAWFERALPVESRRPFATALEAQIALENVVTREVAYSPRPGALRTLLRAYEALSAPEDDEAGEAARLLPNAAPAAGKATAPRQDGDGSRRAPSRTSTSRRAGARGRKAPTPEELEAQEIERLEAELARLMSLEQPEEPVTTEEVPATGKVVPFPSPSDGPVDARIDAPAEQPVSARPPTQEVTEPPVSEPVAPLATDTPVVGPAAAAPLGEEEIAALNALIEIETQASAQPNADVTESAGEWSDGHEGIGAADAVLEVDLDEALDALIAEALANEPPVAAEWVDTSEVLASAASAEPEVTVAQSDVDGPSDAHLVAQPQVIAPAHVAAEAAAVDLDASPVVEPEVDAWSLTPLSEDEAMALARRADAEAEDAVGHSELVRDEWTRALDFESEPEPVALAFAQPYHRRLGAARKAGRLISATDVGRVLALVPRVIEGDPATLVPLKRQPAPRRPAALAGAPEPIAALAANATAVFAALAAYQPAGALAVQAAPAVAAETIADAVGEPAPIEAPALAEATSPTEAIPEQWTGTLEASVEPDIVEAFAPAHASPTTEVSVPEAAELVEATAAIEIDAAAVVEGVQPADREVDSVAEATVTTAEAPAIVVDVVEPVAPPEPPAPPAEVAAPDAPAPTATAGASGEEPDVRAVLDSLADLVDTCEVEASVPPDAANDEADVVAVVEMTPPEPQAVPAAAEAAAPVEGELARAKRRRRRRKKSRRPDSDAAPLPAETAPPAPSPAPVPTPVAPWLRGRDTTSAPPRPAPAVVAPQPLAPHSPASAAPPWTRRGREPLPVLPSTASGPTADVAVTPSVAPIGDALSPPESHELSTASVPPEAAKPVAPVVQAPPPEPAAPEALVEPPHEGHAQVVPFPARRPRMAINWRRTIAASIAIMLIEGGAFAAAYWYVKPREVGYLLVQSTVNGLDVSIDGQSRGKTPLAIELPPGRHTIEMRGRGVTKTVPVEIAANVQTSQMVAWPSPPKVGRLNVKTTPAGAQVTIDGQPRGIAPVTIDDLVPGTHQLVVENESGSVEQSVRIVADETVDLDVQIYSGWLALFAPVEVRIFEDGKLLGTSLDGRILMPPGRHRLELVNQRLGYRQTRDVLIQPGRVLAVSVEAPRGSLLVEAPTGTSVSVDGVAMGVTPLGELSVEVGTREILFHHPELGQRRVTVTVGVGPPARVNMLAPR